MVPLSSLVILGGAVLSPFGLRSFPPLGGAAFPLLLLVALLPSSSFYVCVQSNLKVWMCIVYVGKGGSTTPKEAREESTTHKGTTQRRRKAAPPKRTEERKAPPPQKEDGEKLHHSKGSGKAAPLTRKKRRRRKQHQPIGWCCLLHALCGRCCFSHLLWSGAAFSILLCEWCYRSPFLFSIPFPSWGRPCVKKGDPDPKKEGQEGQTRPKSEGNPNLRRVGNWWSFSARNVRGSRSYSSGRGNR